MHIRSLQVQGIKLFRDLELSFLDNDGAPRMWTVLLGENGLCKTTLLQCIAMAASGTTRANQLADVLSLRSAEPAFLGPAGESHIDAEFGFSRLSQQDRIYPQRDPHAPGDPVLRSTLLLQQEWSEFIGGSTWDRDVLLSSSSVPSVDPLQEARARNLQHWFVAGYGVSRRLPVPNSTLQRSDPAQDRPRSLFDSTYQLVGTDFISRFDSDAANRYVKLLKGVLVQTRLLPDVSNIELRGRGGVTRPEQFVESHRFDVKVGESTLRIPATWLSQGYQSVIAWIADLLGFFFLEGPDVESTHEYEGLVLVDELDLHLHPAWQRTLVEALRSALPRVQFVATTHSPMVLAGLREDEVVRLHRDHDGSVTAQPVDALPALMTGSELYQTFFGITDSFPNQVGRALHRYEQLASNPFRSDAEEGELQQVRAGLRASGIEPQTEPEPRRDVPEVSL